MDGDEAQLEDGSGGTAQGGGAASVDGQRAVGGEPSAEGVTQRIRELGERGEKRIVAMRRHFHRNPELSGAEVETSKRICELLEAMGIEYRLVKGPRPAGACDERESFIGTGIIATIRGSAPGAYGPDGTPAKRVALRADMDALPVDEKTGLDFSSRNEGVMHACGHDCHVAMMLGATYMLNELRDELKGEVRVLFQPAEEISIGARDMIAAGALEGVDAIYGAHVWSEVDTMTFSAEAGQRMASTDWFRIDVKGESAHGSMPHRGVDAIVVAAEMVSSLQVLVSRDVSPFEPVVVTIGELHGGKARNIIASHAYFTGTVRTWDAKTRAMIPERMERICGKLAHAFNADIAFNYEHGNPGLANDEACAHVAQQAVVKLFGEQALASYEGTLAGEDFSEYLAHVPGVFVFVGTNNPAIGATHPQHSCRYLVDERVLPRGAMLATQWACDMLSS